MQGTDDQTTQDGSQQLNQQSSCSSQSRQSKFTSPNQTSQLANQFQCTCQGSHPQQTNRFPSPSQGNHPQQAHQFPSPYKRSQDRQKKQFKSSSADSHSPQTNWFQSLSEGSRHQQPDQVMWFRSPSTGSCSQPVHQDWSVQQRNPWQQQSQGSFHDDSCYGFKRSQEPHQQPSRIVPVDDGQWAASEGICGDCEDYPLHDRYSQEYQRFWQSGGYFKHHLDKTGRVKDPRPKASPIDYYHYC